jgi:hypothetical protein
LSGRRWAGGSGVEPLVRNSQGAPQPRVEATVRQAHRERIFDRRVPLVAMVRQAHRERIFDRRVPLEATVRQAHRERIFDRRVPLEAMVRQAYRERIFLTLRHYATT